MDSEIEPKYVQDIKCLNTEPCKKRQENAKRVIAAYHGTKSAPIDDSEKAVSSCYQQISEAYKQCVKTPTAVPAGSAQGVSGAAANLSATSKNGQAMNDSKSEECKDLLDKAKQHCDERKANLKEALDAHGKQEQELQNQYASNPSPELKSKLDESVKTRRQLEAQIRNTANLTEAGHQALDDYRTCYALEARRNEIVANNSDAIVAASSGQDPTTTIPKLDRDPAPTAAQKLCAGNTSCTVGTDYVSSTLQNQAIGSGLVAASESGALGSAGGAASAVARNVLLTSAGPVAGSAAAGMVLAGVGGAVPLILTPTPTSACDTVFTNSLDANAANCPLTVQSAVNALNGP